MVRSVENGEEPFRGEEMEAAGKYGRGVNAPAVISVQGGA